MSKETFEPLAVKILAHIVDEQDEIIMQTIQQIGGDKYIDVTVDRHKVIEALADYVEKCRRYHPPERKQNGWISVDERLPKEGVDVLVTLKIGDRVSVDTDRIYSGRWFGYSPMRGVSYVTHWMPFPEPPKEGGKA